MQNAKLPANVIDLFLLGCLDIFLYFSRADLFSGLLTLKVYRVLGLLFGSVSFFSEIFGSQEDARIQLNRHTNFKNFSMQLP